MLNFFLVLLCIAIWVALYVLYFREHIRTWIENRFGKDTPPKADEPPAPIKYPKSPQ
ncbi:hypothetical protein Gbth_043_011 [Gluconobacter thailandicus F149-1 = NBRC 100600]|uniref:Uncharacterized protein n=1 Tax=Gluconobacter thailandicus NBRC 3257 TaxID=1381097 RepID=A0ABQ0IYF9_GLUTH|nr:Hypothetical protein B932_0130 [Gluconobacter oxydans H24]GAC87234.1 hypothetical protein NBRC3255_0895 [Gluconobacter thailandicus NBRC 3255]GAD27247.1 hypothetical protein NBRC3257_2246 [Gluconobacter thailandicus NBRC 3257]GAN89342.1 hypothetical protein Gbfr_005_094 [Gluconobacter frateurii M-2]GAN94007.1 hypothetical protein Gbth_043_011 [Gluconobacter thailandicus F149-1 = NBRC 100600]